MNQFTRKHLRKVKQLIAHNTVLAFCNFELLFEMYTDASGMTIN